MDAPQIRPTSIAFHDNAVVPADEDEKIQWSTCCSHSSKAFIKYLTTCSISLIVLIFSMTMIINDPDRDNSIYFSLISSIISLYITPPSVEHEQSGTH